MALALQVLSEIRRFVRGGFNRRDEIIEILCEEMYEPGELDRDEVCSAVDAELAELDGERASWPAVTDCDRLDVVFSELNERGIVALQNAGYTQSDGYDDVLDIRERHPQPDKLIGYCFYHGQDLERAVDGMGLSLAFGPIDPKKEDSEGPAIGRMIVDELKKVGLAVQWDGTFKQRILIENLDWKR